MNRRITALVVALAVGLLGACSEDNTVGEGINADQLSEGEGASRIGETTTTVAPATTAAPAAAPSTTAAPTTTARPTTTAPPTTVQSAAITITITGTAYDPRQAAVRKGSLVKWVNNDSKSRKLVEANGVFTSPVIPPGGTWEYKADRSGKFDYSDPDVPFAQGTLLVS
jgi:plastocyanin